MGRDDRSVPAVEVWRGEWLEAVHRAVIAVVDATGRQRTGVGDTERPVLWRSTSKPFQALVLVESGALDEAGGSEEELAIACASHGGEPPHLAVASALLQRGGFSPADLQCGAHPPMHAPSAEDLIRRGEAPTPLHNNCSGKHAGMLLANHHLGGDAAAYLALESPVQQAIRRDVARQAQVDETALGLAIDGCSAPTFALPLRSLAAAYAGLGEALGDRPQRNPALARIARAMTARPDLVAGTGRFDTALMRARPGDLVAKVGADGMYAVGTHLAGHGIGVAVKFVDGGSDRARHALVRAVLVRLRLLAGEPAESLGALFPAEVRNHRGRCVGTVRIATEALEALRPLK